MTKYVFLICTTILQRVKIISWGIKMGLIVVWTIWNSFLDSQKTVKCWQFHTIHLMVLPASKGNVGHISSPGQLHSCDFHDFSKAHTQRTQACISSSRFSPDPLDIPIWMSQMHHKFADMSQLKSPFLPFLRPTHSVFLTAHGSNVYPKSPWSTQETSWLLFP